MFSPAFIECILQLIFRFKIYCLCFTHEVKLYIFFATGRLLTFTFCLDNFLLMTDIKTFYWLPPKRFVTHFFMLFIWQLIVDIAQILKINLFPFYPQLNVLPFACWNRSSRKIMSISIHKHRFFRHKCISMLFYNVISKFWYFQFICFCSDRILTSVSILSYLDSLYLDQCWLYSFVFASLHAFIYYSFLYFVQISFLRYYTFYRTSRFLSCYFFDFFVPFLQFFDFCTFLIQSVSFYLLVLIFMFFFNTIYICVISRRYLGSLLLAWKFCL